MLYHGSQLVPIAHDEAELSVSLSLLQCLSCIGIGPPSPARHGAWHLGFQQSLLQDKGQRRVGETSA